MKNYRKFAITSAVLLAIVWLAAFTLDMFVTMVLCMPAILYFFASFILAFVRMITKKGVKHNLIVMGLCVLLTFSLGIPAKMANRGLHKLTAIRKTTMRELRPVFIQYRQDKGTYPPALADLVPEYISEIPSELVNDGSDDFYSRIVYEIQGEEAVFIFRTIRGPDSWVIYNIHKDSFWHDS